MGEFPSGQRGQTVNLLRIASVVRIHLPPPKNQSSWTGFCFGMGVWMVDSNPPKCNSPVDCCSRRLDGANPLFSSHREENANRIHLSPPNKHRNLGIKITVLIFDYLPKTMDFTIFCVKFRAAAVLSRSGHFCF